MLQFIILFLFIKITLYSYLVLRKIKLSQNNIGIQKESLAPLVLMGQSLIIKFEHLSEHLSGPQAPQDKVSQHPAGQAKCLLFVKDYSRNIYIPDYYIKQKQFQIFCLKLKMLYMEIFEKGKLRDLGIVFKQISKCFENEKN